MTEVLMVRHGESEHNRDGIIQGQIDSGLTERGMKQARKLGEFLSGEDFDRIFASDLSRAVETAEIALGKKEEIIESEKLRERDYGELEGEGFEVWDELETDDTDEWKAEGMETLSEHKERVMELLEEVVEKDSGEVLVICHGGSIAAAIMWIINSDSRKSWRFSIGSCSLTRIIHTESDGWLVKEVGCTPHL